MALHVEGLVESLIVKGPFPGGLDKNGNQKDDYVFNEITVKGKKVSAIGSANAEPPCQVGDNVRLLYTEKRNGKFVNNTLDRDGLTLLDGDVAPFVEEAPKTVSKSTQKRLDSQTSASGGTTTTKTTVTTPLPSKDISMEVSGILQALIHNEGLNDDTESKLRDALRLKRTVASELEANGTV